MKKHLGLDMRPPKRLRFRSSYIIADAHRRWVEELVRMMRRSDPEHGSRLISPLR